MLRGLNVATFAGLSPHVRGNPDASHSGPQVLAVYPRTCGGTKATVAFHAAYQGLSPHVRGNHLDDRSTELHVRSIPARAGEPRRVVSPVVPPTVYPRTCGGTL